MGQTINAALFWMFFLQILCMFATYLVDVLRAELFMFAKGLVSARHVLSKTTENDAAGT